jgi:hypothetical protein
MASVLFLLFGVWILFDSALGLTTLAIVATTTVAVVALASGLIGFRRARHIGRTPLGPVDQPA